MINVLNFINSDWGKIESIRPVVSLLEPIDRREGSGELISQWAGAVLPSRTEEGRIEATDPWTVISPDSQWQAQFGVRVTFGGDPGR